MRGDEQNKQGNADMIGNMEEHNSGKQRQQQQRQQSDPSHLQTELGHYQSSAV